MEENIKKKSDHEKQYINRQHSENDIINFKINYYEHLSKETYHNGRICWTINSLFITASFVLTAFLFTQNPTGKVTFGNPYIFVDIKLFITLIVLSLLWFSMFFNAGLSKANKILFTIRDDIANDFKMITFSDMNQQWKEITGKEWKRTIYNLNYFIFFYHVIFILYFVKEMDFISIIFLSILLIFLYIKFDEYQSISNKDLKMCLDNCKKK